MEAVLLTAGEEMVDILGGVYYSQPVCTGRMTYLQCCHWIFHEWHMTSYFPLEGHSELDVSWVLNGLPASQWPKIPPSSCQTHKSGSHVSMHMMCDLPLDPKSFHDFQLVQIKAARLLSQPPALPMISDVYHWLQSTFKKDFKSVISKTYAWICTFT